MRNLILITFSILFIGCNHASQIKAQRLQDTIKALRKLADYKPLKSADAYDFINKYYLPRLDTMPTKRKLFVYALNGVDFKELFEYRKSKLEKEYSVDSTIYVPPINPSAPKFISFDKRFKWDIRLLRNTKIIIDTVNDNVKVQWNVKAWRKVYGYGYMCVSYPQYNSNTKRLVLREWTENGDECGTGRERKLYFTKINGGWKAD